MEQQRTGPDAREPQLWIVGGGIAGMAVAAFAIRDARVRGENVHILEESGLGGGALDGARAPGTRDASDARAARAARDAWVTRGGRMLEEEAYQCTWDLFASIPAISSNSSAEAPSRSVRDEILEFNAEVKTDARARLIDARHAILDASEYGFDARDRRELLRLLATSETRLGARRIDELFGAHFFATKFWQMWRTTFAFQNWHSAVELRRYFLRFIQEFERIHTLSGVRRTVYNQYDSMVVPLQRWLVEQRVDVRFGTRVVDVDFAHAHALGSRRATRLWIETAGSGGSARGRSSIELGADDYAFVTIGSITADTTYGGNDTVPPLVRDRRDGAWSLWEKLARKAPDFGNPITFCGNVDEHKWESFTLTMRGDALLKRLVEYSGNTPGTGALMTFVESGWLMSIVVPHQPHFRDLPEGTFTLWGYGLFIDADGDHVKKPMSACTGREILTELVHQLGFDDQLDEVLATTDVTTVMIPYASALFARRLPGDRPKVVPEGAENFAFLGQFTELPGDVVFTVEYSVHGAMEAVYSLLGVERAIPPIYQGLRDPKIALKALRASYR
jgi:oleate hydratase